MQKTSGWKVPVGTLLSKKFMSWVDCDQYASVANFFSSSCAPGEEQVEKGRAICRSPFDLLPVVSLLYISSLIYMCVTEYVID